MPERVSGRLRELKANTALSEPILVQRTNLASDVSCSARWAFRATDMVLGIRRAPSRAGEPTIGCFVGRYNPPIALILAHALRFHFLDRHAAPVHAITPDAVVVKSVR